MGIVVAGILAGFPVVILTSWILDGPPAKQQISNAAMEIWSGRLIEFSYDPEVGIVATLQRPIGEQHVLLAGIESPAPERQTPVDALKWLKRNVPLGTVLVVYVQPRTNEPSSMRAHLVCGNTWINGSLVEQGLAKVSARSPVKANNAGRSALCQLQEEAQGHQRGLWGLTR